MTPLVTIGIPSYNAVRWLKGAIQSALNQTWSATEVIVVDDGSTDGSAEVAKAFGNRIQFVQIPHQGGNAARNEIMRRARGEWIQYLDADDYLEKEKIEKQLVEAQGGADADVIYSPVWVETTTDGRNDRKRSSIDTRLDLYSQWLAWQLPQTGGALWRREALLAIGGWKDDQPCCQEHELYLRALKAQLRFCFAPTPHAVYRIWSNGTLHRKDPLMLISTKTDLIDECCSWLTERNEWSETHQRVAGRACFEMARMLSDVDTAEAAVYHRARRDRGMTPVDGPAEPKRYQMVYRTLGFSLSEGIVATAVRA